MQTRSNMDQQQDELSSEEEFCENKVLQKRKLDAVVRNNHKFFFFINIQFLYNVCSVLVGV